MGWEGGVNVFFVAIFFKIMKKMGPSKDLCNFRVAILFFSISQSSCGLGGYFSDGWFGSLVAQKPWPQFFGCHFAC
jgi:hypothetical protein